MLKHDIWLELAIENFVNRHNKTIGSILFIVFFLNLQSTMQKIDIKTIHVIMEFTLSSSP